MGYRSNPNYKGEDSWQVAQWSYQDAEAMLKDRERVPDRLLCKYVHASDCHGIEIIKSPSGKDWAIGGTDTQDRFKYCPWCGGELPRSSKTS